MNREHLEARVLAALTNLTAAEREYAHRAVLSLTEAQLLHYAGRLGVIL
jgi:hypothetical protein